VRIWNIVSLGKTVSDGVDFLFSMLLYNAIRDGGVMRD